MASAAITIATKDYWHYVLCLFESWRQFRPADDFFVIVLNDGPGEIPDALNVVFAESLVGALEWPRFSFQYTPFELACALKPYALKFLLENDYERVIYVDSDMIAYQHLESLDKCLDENQIVLSPHLVRPFPNDNKCPHESVFLTAGTYNGGLVACRRGDESHRFVRWWQSRLQHDCYVDIARGVFVDQSWLSLVPGMFRKVGFLTSPACNTGHWTLANHEITQDEMGSYFVDGQPLELFHFSMFLPSNPELFLRDQDRFSYETSPALQRLVQEYHGRLNLNGMSEYEALKNDLTQLDNGVPILAEWREAVRRQSPQLSHITNPFSASENANLVRQFKQATRKCRKWRGDWQISSPARNRRREKMRSFRKRWNRK